jgi:hypothetical protein
MQIVQVSSAAGGFEWMFSDEMEIEAFKDAATKAVHSGQPVFAWPPKSVSVPNPLHVTRT